MSRKAVLLIAVSGTTFTFPIVKAPVMLPTSRNDTEVGADGDTEFTYVQEAITKHETFNVEVLVQSGTLPAVGVQSIALAVTFGDGTETSAPSATTIASTFVNINKVTPGEIETGGNRKPTATLEMRRVGVGTTTTTVG